MTKDKKNGEPKDQTQLPSDAQSIEKSPVGVSPSLSDEIDGAIEDGFSTVKPEKKDDPPVKDDAKGDVKPDDDKNDLPPDEDQSGDDDSQDKPPVVEGEGDSDDEIPDTLIERAVKAGFTIADAKEFKTPEALERMCARLEAKSGDIDGKPADTSGNDGEGDEAEGLDVEKLLGSMPEFDPDEYDEKIIEGFDQSKDIIRQLAALVQKQGDTIRGLRDTGASEKGSWVDQKISGLGEGFAEAVGSGSKSDLPVGSPQAAKRAELEKKFTVLEAGYQAAGEKIDRESIFNEAVSLVLGDVAAKAKDDAKAKELAKRKSQHINRPGANQVQAKTDPYEETGDELDRKFFDKK